MGNGGRDRDRVDSVSSLPDEILQHIFSFIPTRFAIRTSVLSKRWRHVWTDTPTLYLEKDLFGVKADSINETLAHYRARNMTSFQLQNSIFEKIVPLMIDTWIEFAMSRNVEVMWLNLCFTYTLPDFFYINSSLKQLTLVFYDFDTKIPSCLVSWPCLKKLSLLLCELSHESLAKILSGCPVLETLTLTVCQKPIVLDLSKSLSLKTLELDNSGMSQPMQIVAPYIHCLRLKTSPELPCTLVDVSSLIEARLDIQFWSRRFDFLQVMALLEKLQNLEKLTFGANFLKILSLAELQRSAFPKFEVKDLTFETTLSRYDVSGIVRVLQNSPQLKKLTLHNIADPVTSRDDEYIDYYLHREGLNPNQCWSLEVRAFRKFHHMNVESKHVASLMKLIFKNTNTLEKMVVRLGGLRKGRCLKQLLEMVPFLSHNNNNVSIVLT